jgi:hypothetical protein
MKMKNLEFMSMGKALSRAEMKKVLGGLIQCEQKSSCTALGTQICGAGCTCVVGMSGGTLSSPSWSCQAGDF